ncbi:unnamed protein product [Rotaria magnacalcarata]|uniref:Uncharacterized protein n=1 Tax=Rotaria magnacalcarata TaxID=392030 RepID=A0A816S7S6_9BILA|nr:unnamed protein product [Rotaria magnacalcarata]CAF1671045.1 unnamed protein product [Rotaria magnacalcarata]CAF1974705.1 unnamed protein product [Rotaria magnacalcarata]CAF2080528.1 unnamed protein product [Rotaria magnacalcarata]CAF2097822.1 unnamed protein product [Rotaria magnacalcarata]
MAKKSVAPVQRYSSGDQCLIALLSEPVKAFKLKPSNTPKIKKSEEFLRSMIYNDLFYNASMFTSPAK